MPDVSNDVTVMADAMRTELDSRGIELTHTDLTAAAIAAFTTLTRPGGVLDSERMSISYRVLGAIDEIRGDESQPPTWEPHRWVNAVVAKLGQAAYAAGLLLDEPQAVMRDAFNDAMIGVAAAAQEAVASRETADARA